MTARRHARFFSHAALPATVAIAAVLSTQALGQPEDAEPASTAVTLSRPTLDELGESPIATLLQSLDDQARRYHDHITTLANPFFEGRAPGLRGNMLAAEYIAFYFKQFGLQPAFMLREQTTAGDEVLTPGSDYFQPFSTGSTTALTSAHFSASGLGDFQHDKDFAALGFSGDESVFDAPLVFVGYALDNARDGYTSFEDDTDLTGKVAIVLRFEPMDEAGRSLWLPGGWSPNAAVEGKFRQCVRRGAAGIILVNAPGADDERMGRLESIHSLAPMFGGPLDIPVIQVSEALAERLVQRADSEGRSLLDLRRLADAGAVVIDLPEETVSIEVALEQTPTLTQNVAGVLPGRGDLADEIIVIGAHYDHVGYGYDGGSRAGSEGMGVLHPGADDNGSGTSGLLLAAEALSKAYADLPEGAAARSIFFIAFSGEELGLLGSAHYVQHPALPIQRHVFMLNMDMIGRLRGGVMELGGVGTAQGLWEHLEPMVEASGLDVRPLPSGVGPSDHTNFYNAGMPVLFFHTLLHDEYHMPSDFSWTINHVGAVRVVNLCVDVALDLATRPEKFSRSTSTRRPRPYVGITGEDNPGGGVLVISVGEDTPASRAGLREDDVIIMWDGEVVEDQGQWRPMLQSMSPGDEVTVTVRRGNEDVELTCTLGRRGG